MCIICKIYNDIIKEQITNENIKKEWYISFLSTVRNILLNRELLKLWYNTNEQISLFSVNIFIGTLELMDNGFVQCL